MWPRAIWFSWRLQHVVHHFTITRKSFQWGADGCERERAHNDDDDVLPASFSLYITQQNSEKTAGKMNCQHGSALAAGTTSLFSTLSR
jgi:hypothetical protein